MNLSPPARVSRRRFLRIVAGAGVVVGSGRLAVDAASERNAANRVTWRGIALGTEVAIELWCDDRHAGREALDACRREIMRLESIFTLYDARSAVGRLNQHGRLANPPPELCQLVRYADRFSGLTRGSFDLTIQPLCELRSSGDGSPTAAEIERVRALVDYRALECRDDMIRLDRRGMKITCNGVAQGYITDRVADLLRQRGFGHTLIDLGEKRALGGHPDSRPWTIGVESPGKRGTVAGTVELENRAVATSGGYGQILGPGGQHHLIDARTASSRNELASISVVAPTAVQADTLSTCLAVLPVMEAGRLLRKFPDCEALVVREPGGTLVRWAGDVI